MFKADYDTSLRQFELLVAYSSVVWATMKPPVSIGISHKVPLVHATRNSSGLSISEIPSHNESIHSMIKTPHSQIPTALADKYEFM